ncbi:MAG: TadE/TadG family type IV pilus assembly protein [Vicinamibacterales bacterium]
MRQLLGRLCGEQAAQLVEFALVLPMLLLVVLGIAEFGFIFQRYEVVTNAAREGARMAVLPGYTADDVTARVRAYVTDGRVPTTLTNPTIAVTNVTIAVGGGLAPINTKQVTVTYTHSYAFLPNIGNWFGVSYTTIPLTAVAQMRNEAGS